MPNFRPVVYFLQLDFVEDCYCSSCGRGKTSFQLPLEFDNKISKILEYCNERSGKIPPEHKMIKLLWLLAWILLSLGGRTNSTLVSCEILKIL